MATSPAATPATPIRLTARGRLLLGASGLVVALSLFSATTALGSSERGTTSAAAGYEEITVLPGESLWSIARQIAPDFGMSTGDIVGVIIDINNLGSSELESGQEIRIPVLPVLPVR